MESMHAHVHQGATNVDEEKSEECHHHHDTCMYSPRQLEEVEEALVRENRQRRKNYILNCLRASFSWINSGFTRRVFRMCLEMPSTVGDGREPIVVSSDYPALEDQPAEKSTLPKLPDPSIILIWNSVLKCVLKLSQNIDLKLPNPIFIQDIRQVGDIKDGEASKLHSQGFPLPRVFADTSSHKRKQSHTLSGELRGSVEGSFNRASISSAAATEIRPSRSSAATEIVGAHDFSPQEEVARTRSLSHHSADQETSEKKPQKSSNKAFETLHELRCQSVASSLSKTSAQPSVAERRRSTIYAGEATDSDSTGRCPQQSDESRSSSRRDTADSDVLSNIDETYVLAPENYETYQIWFKCIPSSTREFARVMYLLDVNAFAILSETGLLTEDAMQSTRVPQDSPSSDGRFFHCLLTLN